jgi:hypothetical protein
MARSMMDIGLELDDLSVISGDLFKTESTREHQKELILNSKGDYKQNPTICVGAFSYMDDESKLGMVRAISIEFARDSMDVKSVSLSPVGDINTNAVYK